MFGELWDHVFFCLNKAIWHVGGGSTKVDRSLHLGLIRQERTLHSLKAMRRTWILNIEHPPLLFGLVKQVKYPQDVYTFSMGTSTTILEVEGGLLVLKIASCRCCSFQIHPHSLMHSSPQDLEGTQRGNSLYLDGYGWIESITWISSNQWK